MSESLSYVPSSERQGMKPPLPPETSKRPEVVKINGKESKLSFSDKGNIVDMLSALKTLGTELGAQFGLNILEQKMEKIQNETLKAKLKGFYDNGNYKNLKKELESQISDLTGEVLIEEGEEAEDEAKRQVA